MKRLLLSLGLTVAVATIANSAVSINISKTFININNQVTNENKYTTNLVEIMNLKISNNNEAEIKKIVLDSLFLLDNQVYINTNLFSNLYDNKLKDLFSDIEFEKTIQDMYQNKILIVNEQGRFIFFDFDIQPQIAGVWAESHWYWFGYWKLHFDHEKSKSLSYLLDVLTNTVELAGIIADWYPWSAIALAVFSGFCFANSLIFDFYDIGKGVWIGWYIVVPDMGWGSN